jgi:hypothetical protein
MPSSARRVGLRIALVLVWVVFFAALLEAGVRAFWMLRDEVPFLEPDRILYVSYPELRRVDEDPPARDDGFLDILLLGGSALHESWSQVEVELAEQLARAGRRDVRIWNLAEVSHTSRDSRLKYLALDGARFDWVVLYHGINDARANNAPPDRFRSDYSHFAWYETANAFASHHGRSVLALPYTIRYLASRVRQALAPEQYLPRNRPHPEWIGHGGSLRSAAALEENLGAILDEAERRGDRVVLMTFATWVPEDYSLQAFAQKQLDYLLHYSPLELWGRGDYVLRAVAAHNLMVRRLAAARADVVFVDQARLMPGGERYFNDACHFTTTGSAVFVDHLLEALGPALDGTP